MITLQNRGQLDELAGRTGGQLPPAPEPAPVEEPEAQQAQPEPPPPAPPAPAPAPINLQPLLDAINGLGDRLAPQTAAPAPGAPKPEILPLLERAAAESPDAPQQALPIGPVRWRFELERSHSGLLERVTARAPGHPTQVFVIDRAPDGLVEGINQEALLQ